MAYILLSGRNKMKCDEYECTIFAKPGDCVDISTTLDGVIIVSFHISDQIQLFFCKKCGLNNNQIFVPILTYLYRFPLDL